MILTEVIIVLSVLVAAGVVHLLSSIAALSIAAVRIDEIAVFGGPTLIRFKLGTGLPIKIGFLPIGGGSISFDTEDFWGRSLLTRLAVRLSGPVFIFITSAICLGFGVAFPEFINGFGQILNGALSPLQYGPHLIEKYFVVVEDSPVIAGYGVLAAKIAAYNLLPIPGLNGGQVIMETIPWLHPSKRGISLIVIGMLINLAIVLSWVVAFVGFIIRTY